MTTFNEKICTTLRHFRPNAKQYYIFKAKYYIFATATTPGIQSILDEVELSAPGKNTFNYFGNFSLFLEICYSDCQNFFP